MKEIKVQKKYPAMLAVFFTVGLLVDGSTAINDYIQIASNFIVTFLLFYAVFAGGLILELFSKAIVSKLKPGSDDK